MASSYPEGFGPETYGASFADVYDRWYTDVSDAGATVDFIVGRLGGGSLLELGSGTGRLAAPLSTAGVSVTGVDVSTDMLQRQTSPTPAVGGDLRALPFRSGVFSGALCAFNTLFNLPDPLAQRSVLREAARVVEPGGSLFIEAMTGAGLADGDARSVGVSQVSVDRVVLTVTVIDADRQTITGQHVEIRQSGIRLRPWFIRWTTPSELDRMASATGLELVERCADWVGSPFDPAGRAHVSVYRTARRPSAE